MKQYFPSWRRFGERLRDRWDFILMTLLVSGSAVLAGADSEFGVVLLLFSLIVILLYKGTEDKDPPEQLPVAPSPILPHGEEVEGLVQATITAIDLPCVVFGSDGGVVFQNGAAEKAFGKLETGMHISARWRSPGILDMVRETVGNGLPNQIEHSEVLPSERVFAVRVAPLSLPQLKRDSALFVMTFRDISELRRIDRMRSDFVANASHELRTPLASLRGFIETLLGPARNDLKAQERFLGIMLDQANRMSRLVDDLLSLSRLELKAHLAPDQKVALQPVLSHVRDSLTPLAAELDVDLRLHLPQESVEVTGDRDELIQVFENLIENACKYGQEGKQVDVFLRQKASGVEVSVVDKGPGVPAEDVPRLTERFYRVSVADSRSKKGTGLGLAIVKHILTRHRARLIIRSELGQGTDFTVRF
ncbi:phosphate regulon sensor histidine kinase PhoR [Agrobacterium vitis]|uniref:histidine kinase n=2 Tax=Agrobacterium vitis TaxID=373 RepID=A0A6L6VK50_AGRVI|nr:phosphate regulon sensor histidine kinase PhoR [Agrobacterium vitis]MUZ75451.1 phosphate regulon sensor histidine kinase PhoR [Agrobacterium vitis]